MDRISSTQNPQDPAESADASAGPRTKRPRRRAGAPAGAPSVAAPVQAPPADQAPRTIVPEQRAAAETPTTHEQPAARPARSARRRAGAPAGPPALPAEPQTAPVAAGTAAAELEEAEVQPEIVAPEAAERDREPSTPLAPADVHHDEESAPDELAVPAEQAASEEEAATAADGDTGIAGDLRALADRRGARSERGGRGRDAQRQQAQLDFASLIFQAPSAVEPEAAAAEEEAEDGHGSAELSFDAPSSRRSRSRRRSGSAQGAPSAREDRDQDEDEEKPARPDEAEADETDVEETGTDRSVADEVDSTEDESSSRRRRRRGGRGRRGRGRSDEDDPTGDDPSDEDETDEDSENEGAADAEQEDGEGRSSRSRSRSRSRRRGGQSSGAESAETAESEDQGDAENGSADADEDADDEGSASGSSSRRRRRRRRSGTSGSDAASPDDPPNTVVKVRDGRDEVRAVKGSTRLEAKKQRRREGRDAGRRRTVITEAEFLARRESVKRSMIVRERPGLTQIAVLEDDVLVEHYVAQKTQTSMVGNVYLGKVQNVLPSMEAAFVDIGKGRNAVLYAGEVNWDAAGLEGQPRRIELALSSGDPVLVQVTKDPIGHKGARLTSQISLPGRYVVLVPGSSMTGISRKLPEGERTRLKRIMKAVIPEGAGVIVRTAAEGASEEELTRDVERLRSQWEKIQKAEKSKNAPASLSQEPDIAIKVVRDVFNEDFTSLIVEGESVYRDVHEYVSSVAPDLLERVTRHVGERDAFAKHRVDEQLLKAMDRKVYLPSGGSLVIDRTEAMTVIDVNTGKYTGSGGSLEETVTRNNLEAAEEIVRQLRLRDIGGIIVVDYIDMVLESNRDLVLRRMIECLGRDRTKHQVAEVTSLGLVQMTRKRVGAGLVETFSTTCEHCSGRGLVLDLDASGEVQPSAETHDHGSDHGGHGGEEGSKSSRRRGGRSKSKGSSGAKDAVAELAGERSDVHRLQDDEGTRALARATIASIAAATGSKGHPEVVVAGEVVQVEAPQGDAGEQDAPSDAPSDAPAEDA